MKVENKVTPNEAQIKGFFEAGSEGPIYMLNLLKFKDDQALAALKGLPEGEAKTSLVDMVGYVLERLY